MATVSLALTVRNEETWQIFLSALGMSPNSFRFSNAQPTHTFPEAKHLLTEFIDLAMGDESPFFQLFEGIDQEVKVIKVFGG